MKIRDALPLALLLMLVRWTGQTHVALGKVCTLRRATGKEMPPEYKVPPNHAEKVMHV